VPNSVRDDLVTAICTDYIPEGNFKQAKAMVEAREKKRKAKDEGEG